MEIVKSLSDDQRKEAQGKLDVLKVAHEAKEIHFTRTKTYRKNKVKQGFIFYRIKYISENKIVYDGAYQMRLDFETGLIKHDNLTLFLLSQLAKEL